jgi:hypothetical protein
MMFIADEGRKPSQTSSDAGERKLACWIALSKKNNERELLMRRDILSTAIAAPKNANKENMSN